MKNSIRAAALLAATIMAVPQLAQACACGCGIFEVGTASMLPTAQGGMAWLEYDNMDQNQNWHGNPSAPKANNDDREIRSNFFTAGGQYMFNRSWGVMAEMPYTDRYFRTLGNDGGDDGDIIPYHHGALGDIRLKAIYSGFSEDMSTGLTMGVKLPTGEFNDHGFDRDTAIGSGSTDIIPGAYHMGALAGPFSWFVNGQYDHPVAARDGYRPGDEFDGSLGSYYNGWTVGGGNLSPLLQLLFSQRAHDAGVNADPTDSGYTRVYISPGVEYDIGRARLYSDVELPVYQYMHGDQLVAPVLVKVSVGYSF